MTLPIIFFTMLSATAIDEVAQTAVIDDIKDRIQTYYIEEASIEKINHSFADPSLKKFLHATKNPKEFAAALNQHLKQFDVHFTVQHSVPNVSVVTPRENWFSKLERKNFGITKVEVLEGNVGLFEFWGFSNTTDDAKQRFTSALKLLADVDAMIIDLRKNGGGSGEMVQWLSSYFLKGRVHLNSFYTRYSHRTQEFWSDPKINNAHLESIPLFILVSDQTFSAAEEFAYNLKHLERATIVGEPTKGGANPWRWFELDNGYRIGVPLTKAINPVTMTNWEGKGVQPHFEVRAELAFNTAYAKALHAVLSKSNNTFQREEIEKQLTLFGAR